MRGKAIQTSARPAERGITPAHAGKSRASWPLRSAWLGSPPHMRGKGTAESLTRFKCRITPAHAGKRVEAAGQIDGNRDHPRTCGEKFEAAYKLAYPPGSPPHMRGKVFSHTAKQRRLRITPAHAGKSSVRVSRRHGYQDHPRTCGEKWTFSETKLESRGSPPHMRGKASGAGFASVPLRITPAHAGKRLKRSRSIVPHAAIVPLFPSVCNKPAGSDGSPAGHDAPPFLPIENAAPASPAYNLRSL